MIIAPGRGKARGRRRSDSARRQCRDVRVAQGQVVVADVGQPTRKRGVEPGVAKGDGVSDHGAGRPRSRARRPVGRASVDEQGPGVPRNARRDVGPGRIRRRRAARDIEHGVAGVVLLEKEMVVGVRGAPDAEGPVRRCARIAWSRCIALADEPLPIAAVRVRIHPEGDREVPGKREGGRTWNRDLSRRVRELQAAGRPGGRQRSVRGACQARDACGRPGPIVMVARRVQSGRRRVIAFPIAHHAAAGLLEFQGPHRDGDGDHEQEHHAGDPLAHCSS